AGAAVSHTHVANTIEASIGAQDIAGVVTESSVTSSGAVLVRARDDADLSSSAAGVGVAASTAIGASAAYNEIENSIRASIRGATVDSGTDVVVAAAANADVLAIGAGIAASNNGIAGSAATNFVDGLVEASIQGASTTVDADGSVVVSAESDNSIAAYTGVLGVGLGTVGAGGSAVVNETDNEVRAFIADDASVIARAEAGSATIKKWADDDSGTEST